MKSFKNLILAAITFSQFSAFSQNEYFTDNPKWGISEPCQFSPFEPEWGKKTTFFIDGDTLLDDEAFVKIFQVGIEYYGVGTENYTETAYSNPLPIAFLRSEEMKMFKWNEELNIKEQLYDFDVNVGELFNTSVFPSPLNVVAVSTILIGGFERKVITVSDGSGETCAFDYIEGVGHWRGIWQPNEPQLDCQSYLTCFSLNGQSYFINEDETPWLTSSAENCEFVVSIDEIAAQGINVYPNPVTNHCNIASNVTVTSIQILDIVGQIIYTTKPNTTLTIFSLEALPNGYYFVKATTENGIVLISKFLKA